MQRTGISMLIVAVALVGFVAAPGAMVGAQESTPAAPAGHPIVGAWTLDTDADDPANPPSLVIFSSDGTYLQEDADGSSGVGAWEATGERSVTLTILFTIAEEAGFAGTGTVRASLEVDESGNRLSGSYTFEFVAADGTGSGEMGPGTAVGERIAVEAPGTPVAPFGPPATPTS